MAGLFSQASLEQIRAASDIVDVIGGYVPLKRAGANWTALCPFHKEKTPSFNVNPHKQIFHCFGCHKGGDVFKFVQEYENIGFVDAVRRLADRAKIPLEMDSNPHAQENRHIKDQLLQIHDQLATRWQNCLANEAAGQVARDYLAKRGVSEEAIKLFRIGAAPEVWDDTVNWATSKGFDLATVEKAGLILKKEGSDHHYDRFRGRLMFPICDEQGRVVAFSGRVLSGDEKTAKYVNSPETPIFTKGKIFYGLDKAKRPMLDEEEAIICEGQLDLIACHMAGVKNVIAPQGTALTADHARIIRRYVKTVAVCFDADSAGRNAAIRALDPLLSADLGVLVAIVPAPHDPDSYIKEYGAEGFRELIAKAPGFFDFYLDYLCAKNDPATDQGRIAIVKAMAESLQTTGSAVLLDTHAQRTARRLGIAAEAARKEFIKIARAVKPALQSDESVSIILEATEETTGIPLKIALQEDWLLKLLLLNDAFAQWLGAHLDLNWISNQNIREIIARRLDAEKNNSWRGAAEFLSDCETPALQRLITEALTGELVTHKDGTRYPQKARLDVNLAQVEKVVLDLRNHFLDSQLTPLIQRAAHPDLNDIEQVEILKQQMELRKAKQQPL